MAATVWQHPTAAAAREQALMAVEAGSDDRLLDMDAEEEALLMAIEVCDTGRRPHSGRRSHPLDFAHVRLAVLSRFI